MFAVGYSYTRGFTHPYLAERVGPAWVTRDARRTRGNYRIEECIAYDVPPEEVGRLAREHTRGRYAVCAIRSVDEPFAPLAPLRDAYKALGYRLSTTEPFMVQPLPEIPKFAVLVPIQRIVTREVADHWRIDGTMAPLSVGREGTGSSRLQSGIENRCAYPGHYPESATLHC